MNRRRPTMAMLFSSVGLSSTGFIAAVTVLPLVAEDVLGASTWSGVPSSVIVIGTALGAQLLSRVMIRKGRREGLVLGYAVAAVSAALAAVATAAASFPALMVSTFVLGVGYSANRLARYAAAELYPPARRGSAIGCIVWAGTIGSVLGPALLDPSRRVAESFRLPGPTGAFLLSALGMAAAMLLVLGATQGWPPSADPSGRRVTPRASVRVLDQMRVPPVPLALTALIVGQVAMVLIMTMTPVHMRHGGEGLLSIGLVISAHTLGMYAFSPVTGWLNDRLGTRPVIVAGTLMLFLASILASAVAPGHSGFLALALFLLGLGWNFGFVSGSALLGEGVHGGDRVRLEGAVDSAVWLSAAVASAGSGLLLSGWGYSVLSLAGAGLSLLPLAALLRENRTAARAEAPS